MRGMVAAAMAAALCVSACGTDVMAQNIWTGKDGNIRNIDTRALVVEDEGLYMATKNEVYRSSGDKWQAIFSLPSGENEITCLAKSGRDIFAGTKRGLFRSRDYGRTWNNVFKTILPEKNNVLCIEASRHSPKKILIGTEKGVFSSDDAGDHWVDISGVLKNRRARCVGLNENAVFVCSDEGLYVMKDCSGAWERVYVTSKVESGDEESSGYADSEGDRGAEVACIAIKKARIYIGAGKNILYSDDHGKAWSAFTTSGLAGAVVYIAIAEKSDRIYCATTKGVFEFSKEKARWMELYRGMDKAAAINRIIVDGEKEGSLWALTDRGLYRLDSARFAQDQYIDVERDLKSMKIIFDNEPSFKDLREAALRFNEVSPEKISKWRSEARLRALLPKVSVGMNNDRSANTEIYTSATKVYSVVGPDDTSNGLDLSVSWELGDLIWSDDQTNIDVRSRLNTQLRNDILDDLRRVYYERKRLQFELAAAPPQDPKARFDKEMRIQELGQAIDDLTGNHLSEHTKKSCDTV